MSSTKPSPTKRRKTTKTTIPSPKKKNHLISAPIFLSTQVDRAIQSLKNGTHEAVIIDANLNLPFDGETMVRFWNARVRQEHRVPAPTSSDDLSVATYNLPGIAGGMWHAYSTRAHDVALDSPIVDQIFTEMTGTPNWQAHPNRLRFNPVNADDGWKAAHLEGEYVFEDSSDVGSIVCESAGRTFTYYEGSNNSSDARALYKELGGPSSKFVKVTQQQLSQWRRVTIQTTKPGQIILFAGSVIHEISRLNRSLSLFLSPYNPNDQGGGSSDDTELYYADCTTRKEAKAKQAAAVTQAAVATTPPLLPPRLLTAGQQRQHPSSYVSMTRRETEIFGSLFHITGSFWPSGKPSFFLMHMMAFNAFSSKFLPFMFDKDGKYSYEIITPDLVKDCVDFDMEYFQKLPLALVTKKEEEEMREKYVGIPEQAWEVIKYWTKDPRKCSDTVSYRRGYLVEK